MHDCRKEESFLKDTIIDMHSGGSWVSRNPDIISHIMSLPIDNKVFSKTVFVYRYFWRKLGSRGLPPEQVFEVTPSKTLENALLWVATSQIKIPTTLIPRLKKT